MATPNELEQVEKEIEISIEAAKSAVDAKNAIEDLFKSKSFKLIFEEGYFRDEAARLVGCLTESEFSSADGQMSLKNDMLGISSVRQYLLNRHRLGVQMERQIAESESELEAMRNEGE